MKIQTCRWENCKWTKYIDQNLKTDLMMVMMEAKKIILMVLASTWEDVCARMFSPQSCPSLCDPMDYSLPGSSEVCGIFQMRILKWVAIPFSRGSPRSSDQTRGPASVGGFFTSEPPEKPAWEDSGSLRRNWKYEERGVALYQELI